MRGRIARKIYKRGCEYEFKEIVEGVVIPKKLRYTRSQYFNARHIFLKQFMQWHLCSEAFSEMIGMNLSDTNLILESLIKKCQEKYRWTKRKATANVTDWNNHIMFRNRRNKDYEN